MEAVTPSVDWVGYCWKCGERLRRTVFPEIVQQRQYLFDNKGLAGCLVNGFHELAPIGRPGAS